MGTFCALAPVGLVVAYVALGALVAPGATADEKVKTVKGTVTDHVVECTSPAVLCTAGELKGDIKGELDFAITSLTPVPPDGALAFTAVSTIRTSDGDLHCTDSGSFNSSATGQGEGVHLCIITGGTGRFAEATGYLQEWFNFGGTTGEGRYVGTIVEAGS